jgi:hypothetical protein
MQIHSSAVSRFSKDQINEFWRVVDSINWPERQDATVVRSDLMMQMSPRSAEVTKRIATFYALNLVNEFKSWQHSQDDTKTYNLYDLECAASNVIGGGKINYEEYFKSPHYLVNEVDAVDVANNFLHSLPTEDDYYTTTLA